MRTNRRILSIGLLIVALAAIAGLLLVLGPPPEPVYKGRPLGYWLQGYDNAVYNNPNQYSRAGRALDGGAPPTREQAEEAVGQLGTNVIPTLLRMIQQPSRSVKDRVLDVARKQHVMKVPFYPHANPHFEALWAFQTLGPNGSDAVPQLIAIFDRNPDAFPQQAIPAILGQIGPLARRAVPMLVRASTHTNEVVRNNAVFALRRIGKSPELVVPALINRLKDTNAQVRLQAANALGAFGSDARSAVPALVELWSREGGFNSAGTGSKGLMTSVGDSWKHSSLSTGMSTGMGPPDVAGAARDALSHIDAEAAVNAGVK